MMPHGRNWPALREAIGWLLLGSAIGLTVGLLALRVLQVTARSARRWAAKAAFIVALSCMT